MMSNSIKWLNADILSNIFKDYPLYSQDNKKDKKVILEVFIPNQNMYWLLLEGNKEEDDFTFFGYCKILEAEFGYVSFNELHSLKYDIQYIHHSIPISLEELQAKYKIN